MSPTEVSFTKGTEVVPMAVLMGAEVASRAARAKFRFKYSADDITGGRSDVDDRAILQGRSGCRGGNCGGGSDIQGRYRVCAGESSGVGGSYGTTLFGSYGPFVG
ncbi:hypothetical protein chiPu_0000897 [Chiloscyllium punctatum]|uniref:Uncharacterized protein n=1 Tax=Chiloscyllium punctatum TaxID=137246 RepID=A0A401RWN6_CHIPU|nr:hypothetical protein [Chiloscyllium punctatum]